MNLKFLIITVFTLLTTSLVFGQYDGYKRNADGGYSVGGCYDGYKRNADGSYSVGWGKCKN